MGHGVKTSKKLIEVALPLDAINAASVREKSIRHGHPSTLHLWWARRPLAAARAVIFSQMVDDPSAHPDRFPTEKAQAQERERLFGIIRELVEWENTNNEQVLEQAREEIRESWLRTCTGNADHPRAAELFDPDRLPAFHDPFAGGGALPLEAQRLGLEAHASDLNPVAVLINKAMIEVPPRFAGKPPVNPDARAEFARGARWNGKGAQGLAEDVRYYGRWMRDEAEKRIGHLYPKIEVTAAMAAERPALERYVGRKLTVIAWLWARTVKSPNPAFAHVDVPLASTFMLSTKKGKEAWVEPVVEGDGYRFTVRDSASGSAGVSPATDRRSEAEGPPDPESAGFPPAQGTKLGRGAHFRCLMSDAPIPGDYIKAEGRAGRMGARLMAIVAEGDRSRVYLPPTSEHEERAREAAPEWKPEQSLPDDHRNFWTFSYGLTTYGDLFTPRQLVALTTFSDLVTEAITRVKQEILGARASRPLKENAGGTPALPGDDGLLPHKSWHSRGYLPHLDQPELIQFVTFRLSDSVPAEVVTAWKEELALTGREPADDPRLAELRERIERYSDQGHGACWLRDDRIAASVQKTLLHFDGVRYRLLAWVIMPNHVHALIETLPGFPLGGIVHSWKSFSAKQANKLLGRIGPFWMEDYFDRYIRSEEHFVAATQYIEQNPVKAGLVRSADDWQWGSVLGKDAGETPAFPGDDLPLRDGGAGATAYAEAVGVYLAFAQSKACDRNTGLCRWEQRDKMVGTFSRQALPMVWDFAETNPLAGAGGDVFGTTKSVYKVVEKQFRSRILGRSCQLDAAQQDLSTWKVVSTDPPYYDNVGYADLSDFFYVWLRRSLRSTFPNVFSTLAVPKAEELVATPYRHGGKNGAETFFLDGMTRAMQRLAEQTHPGFPVTIYYAFKQSERKGDTGVTSTGWETFLDAVIRSGFAITGTWPMRTELGNRMIGIGANALASSIVLVCRRRSPDTPPTSRRDFLAALRSELPPALADLQKSNIAPVDFAQAAIGPGMAIFTRYARVLEADGSPMPVRSALVEINRTLDETLARQEGDLDPDTRFCVAWYEQYGVGERAYGEAEVLFSAKNTSFEGLQRAGVLAGGKGKVRLMRRDELDPDWNPATDRRITDWESAQHLTRSLTAERGGGVAEAARLVLGMGAERAEKARALAYRLYSLAERKRWTDEAHAYNILVTSWPQIRTEAARLAAGVPEQAGFGFSGGEAS